MVVLQAELRLVPSPPCRSLLVLGYSDIYQAGDHVREILEHRPIGREGMDDLLVKAMQRMRLHPEELDLLLEGADGCWWSSAETPKGRPPNRLDVSWTSSGGMLPPHRRNCSIIPRKNGLSGRFGNPGSVLPPMCRVIR